MKRKVENITCPKCHNTMEILKPIKVLATDSYGAYITIFCSKCGYKWWYFLPKTEIDKLNISDKEKEILKRLVEGKKGLRKAKREGI